MAEIRHAAMRVPGARGIEKCFARKTGLRYHVDLHLEVDPDLSVRESHDIATAVRDAIKERGELGEGRPGACGAVPRRRGASGIPAEATIKAINGKSRDCTHARRKRRT